ncbi:MAG: tetraacyldisaccharide 4'-kinase [Chitinophagaceae bacterium]|nr:MAG: tetraacyldisaccharide 4'-kinase [Chitinophagaceae bacterium]
MIRKSRYLLYPISLLYSFILWLRNFLYDKNILKSAAFNFPIICVGNLATGGTGKTPMTEYLVEMLMRSYKVATLSRGYKRKTKGFAIAHAGTTAIQIGDEPMQFHQKFPDVTVAVGEERLVAIPQLLHDRPETEVIILDDAFQHRQVRAGLNILLTEYKNPYVSDEVLPAGNLRDNISSASRADVIVVTKCPPIGEAEKNKMMKRLRPLANQKVFFTKIVYAAPLHLFSKITATPGRDTAILLLFGIANPAPFITYAKDSFNKVELMEFNDHHIFRTDDLQNIRKNFESLESTKKIILTTEKDGVRLEKFRNELEDYPICVLPMRHEFLFNEGSKFESSVVEFVESNKPK